MTSARLLVSGVGLAACLACGDASMSLGGGSVARAAVTDGELASAAEVGATVSLYFSSMGESGCTGTLIAPRVVVTAAHCVADVSASMLQVVVGSTTPADADDEQFYGVESATAHPEYRSDGYPTDDPAGLSDERDIAVLVLTTDVSGVEPARTLLPSDFNSALTPETDLVITGYGQTAEGWDADYGRLYIASTPYVRRSDGELLAGGPGTPDTCYGDSGGPAYAMVDGERHLAGITSRGASLGDGSCGSGGIYTLFGAYFAFVEEASGGLWSPGPVDDGGDGPPDDPADQPGDDDPIDDPTDDPDEQPGDPADQGPTPIDPDLEGGTGDTPTDDLPPPATDDLPQACSAAGTPLPVAALLLLVLRRRRRF